MNNKKLFLFSLFDALGTVIYVTLVALIMFNGNRFFGHRDTILTPVAVLLLFVVSASITGSLILGRPVLLYIDGKKTEGIKLFFYTLGWLLVCMVMAFVLMATIFKTY